MLLGDFVFFHFAPQEYTYELCIYGINLMWSFINNEIWKTDKSIGSTLGDI